MNDRMFVVIIVHVPVCVCVSTVTRQEQFPNGQYHPGYPLLIQRKKLVHPLRIIIRITFYFLHVGATL